MATPDDLQTWRMLYAKLSDILEPLWLSVFPSTRVLYAIPPDSADYAEATKTTDAYDQHVWRFLAAFALEGNAEQHTKLVRELRGKIMSNLKAARMGLDERERIRKVRNVNLFLNTLGLDSSQIPLQ
jgi:DNA topoisomerase 2-associated protein PAT1